MDDHAHAGGDHAHAGGDHAHAGGPAPRAALGLPTPQISHRGAGHLRVDVSRGHLAGEERDDWNKLVDSSGPVDVTQLTGWATIRASVGYEPAYVRIWSGNELVAGAQILCRKLPVFGILAYVPHGPVISEGVERASTLAAIAAALQEFGARTARMLVVQPPMGGTDVYADLLRNGFRRSSVEIAPATSVRVDLTPSEDEIRSRLSRRLRTWTRQWAARGVRIREGTDADLPIFADLVAKSAAHQGFTPFNLDYLRILYGELAVSGHAVLLIGEVAGVPVAGELYTGCGSVLTARLCGLDRNPETAHLNVASAVTWEAVRWARKHDYSWLDLGGVRPETARSIRDHEANSDVPLPSTDVWKLKFGGQLTELPPVVEVNRLPMAGNVFRSLRRSRLGRRLIGLTAVALRGQRRSRGSV
ncbi:MAG: peptidoglycan bridge formation glycyltransferase FemA/FemB family protein [Pseudonocardia sp.]|nr:peptidoglycan bridge formation glycyltransferase FemA/FemB family protein [Pseudonocardia sp.]